MVSTDHIKNINTLTKNDKDLIFLMKEISLKILNKKDEEIIMGFHRVFSTSIDHLHMHVFVLPFKSYMMKLKYTPFFFVTW